MTEQSQTATREETSDAVPNGEHVVRLVELGSGAVGHLRCTNYAGGMTVVLTVMAPACVFDNGVAGPPQSAQVHLGEKDIAALIKALTSPLRMEERS